jgi:propionate catabolism operon transcriptional regulator
VAVNCAAVAESLLESELFGYEEGAFTGARRGGKAGLFEAAHRGTLFLDEIGDMPVALQTRLLRVLQEQEVLRVGATEPTPIQVRVIAATHHDLPARVREGRFRLDLYYRLNILRLDVPPLRDRPGDVQPLAEALHLRICRRLGVRPQATLVPLRAMLMHAQSHDWPGNVRELENLIERLVAYAGARDTSGWQEGATLEAFLRLAAPEVMARRTPAPVPAASGVPTLGEVPEAARATSSTGAWRRRHAQAERNEILQAIADCGGDRQAACLKLGISRTTLWRKLRQSMD